MKEEVIITGPKFRQIEGVTMEFDEEFLNIFLSFEMRSKNLALAITEYEISDYNLEIEKITVNNNIVYNIENNCLNEKEILDKIEKYLEDKNKITIKVKDIDTIDYEMGCLFYKTYGNDDKHRNEILDEWEKDK